MITFWKRREDQIIKSALLEKSCWVEVTAPTPLETESLHAEHSIPPDLIQDILDADERPRLEREDSARIIILRVPVHRPGQDVAHTTIPLGIVVLDELIVTVCAEECEVLNTLRTRYAKSLDVGEPRRFALKLFLHVATYYLRYLKEINKQTTVVEKELQRSIRNTELVRLLNLEKSLVFFTTSLKGNELLLQKLQKTFLAGSSEDEVDELEDVVTENRQAIEMANIYSNILSGMMDAFASVISNNLNVVMKRLTMISVVLMVPTLIASLYGMNLRVLPFAQSPWAFAGILGASALLAAGAALVIRIKRFAR